jgi:predicted acyl esterase
MASRSIRSSVSPRRALALCLLVAGASLQVAAQVATVEVPAYDGALLATDVYRIPFTHARPVVVMRTPYGRDGLSTVCTSLNLLGYNCVAQDQRGLGGSGGGDGTIFLHDGDDGRATLEWVAAQDWCDGRIAAFGGSALGITAYQLAPDAVPDLRCTLVGVASADLFHAGYFQGGAIREADIRTWLEGLALAGFYDQMKQHRLWDSWWQSMDVLSRSGQVVAPGLHLAGWYDVFQQGTLDAWAAFQHRGGDGAAGRQFLVVGPWTHGDFGSRQAGELEYPANAALDLVPLVTDWFGYWLKGDHTGVDRWPAVRVYLMGAVGEEAPGNLWLDLDDWPPPARTVALHLGADGSLTRELPAATEVELLVDPGDPVPTLGGANLYPDLDVGGRPMGAGPFDQRPVEARDDVLGFSSEPLAEPLVVVGRVRCRLWVRPDTPDLDLSVRLTDVYPDGRSMLVVDGIQRARFRCGDDRECLLVPGEPTLVEVDLWSTALVFAAGHRVRVDVAGSNAPRFEVNPNDGGDLNAGAPVVARPRLLLGASYPSALLLPVLDQPRRPAGRVGP